MRFWCSRVLTDWSWTWKPYWGVWVLVALIAFVYARSWRRHLRVTGRSLDRTDKKHIIQFVAGLLALWVASDWPVGLLGASYLVSIHMLQFLLYVLGAAPLLLLGTPEWMARRGLHRLRLDRPYRFLARPIPAAIMFNIMIICTHAPLSVDFLRGSQVGSFLLDMVWLTCGLIVWSPVVSPLPEVVHPSVLVKMAFMFLGIGGVSIVPAGFMVFADNPLYGAYELAPRVGLTAVDDQQLAGAFMKVGMMPVVWITMAVMWSRWFHTEHAADQSYRRDHSADSTTEV